MAKFGGGYDYEFFNTPPKSLECSICLLTLRDPHVTTCCGNHFCFSCINRIATTKKPCPLCKDSGFTTFLHKGVVREVNALKIFCPNKTQGCDWVGELGQVQKHLDPEDKLKDKGCGFIMVECKYKCGTQFHRQMIMKHETEECIKRPLEVQMAFLMKKFESLTTESKAKMEAIEVEVSLLKAENTLLKKQVEIHSPPASVPPFYFSVPDYIQLRTVKISVRSPPFYSHPGGYKMELEVAPNGLFKGQGTHLSVYIRILRGEYDDKLQWPFKGKIFIEIYNYKQENWTDNACIEIKNTECGERSIESRGCVSLGYPQFKSNDLMKKEFLRDDLCKLRVTEVQVL